MRRRELILGLAGAAALPRAAATQAQQKPRLIGLMSPFSRRDTEAWHRAFIGGLHDLGWIEGTNLTIERRYADGHRQRLAGLVDELIAAKVDLIVVAVMTDALVAAKATKTVPIVMASAGDPVGSGLIPSLARPGGNVTGLTQISTDLTGKRLELLKEVAPSVARLAVLWNPRDSTAQLTWREIQEPARRLGIALHSIETESADGFDAAFATVISGKDDALAPLPAPIFVVGEKRVADFAVAHRLPSMFHLPEFPHAGGLMSYGPDRGDLFRRAATYVDKILKGARPGDLPVEQPTKFQFVLNLRTAKALGLGVPRSILAQADEVIE